MLGLSRSSRTEHKTSEMCTIRHTGSALLESTRPAAAKEAPARIPLFILNLKYCMPHGLDIDLARVVCPKPLSSFICQGVRGARHALGCMFAVDSDSKAVTCVVQAVLCLLPGLKPTHLHDACCGSYVFVLGLSRSSRTEQKTSEICTTRHTGSALLESTRPAAAKEAPARISLFILNPEVLHAAWTRY